MALFAVVSQCAINEPITHDCSKYSVCADHAATYNCTCEPDYADKSRRFKERPGRECVKVDNITVAAAGEVNATTDGGSTLLVAGYALGMCKNRSRTKRTFATNNPAVRETKNCSAPIQKVVVL
jgi:hypothetical protein